MPVRKREQVTVQLNGQPSSVPPPSTILPSRRPRSIRLSPGARKTKICSRSLLMLFACLRWQLVSGTSPQCPSARCTSLLSTSGVLVCRKLTSHQSPRTCREKSHHMCNVTSRVPILKPNREGRDKCVWHFAFGLYCPSKGNTGISSHDAELWFVQNSPVNQQCSQHMRAER